MDTQILFRSLKNMGFTYRKIAESFGTSTGTVSAWVKDGARPKLTEEDILVGVDACREDHSSYKEEHVFVASLIENLDISLEEKNHLRLKYSELISGCPAGESAYKKFMTGLISDALEKNSLSSDIVSYDPTGSHAPVIGIGISHIVAVREDGHVLSTGSNDCLQCATHAWRDIASVSACHKGTVGLRKDGSCIAVGDSVMGNGEIYKWDNIVSISCGTWHTIGLMADGCVKAYGRNGYGQSNLKEWKNIVSVAAGHNHSVGLKRDGTVIAQGNNEYHQCDVDGWTDVHAIAAGGDHTLGLTVDGRILATGDIDPFHFEEWQDIVSIATGTYHVAGLKKDGTVIATGHEAGGQCDVFRWHDVIAIYAGFFKTVGIRADGRVLVTVDKHESAIGYAETEAWKLFDPTPNVILRKGKFEEARTQVIDMLKNIMKYAVLYMPFINSYAGIDDIHIIEHTVETDRIVFEMYSRSKELWELYKTLSGLPPIANLLLGYNASFADFLNTLSKSESGDRNDGLPVYEPSIPHSYETFITYVTVMKNTIRDLENL